MNKISSSLKSILIEIRCRLIGFPVKAIPLLFLVLFTHDLMGQDIRHLKEKILEVVKGKDAIVGISIMGMDGQDTLTINGERHFPMQSVFKFPIALTVLKAVDAHKLSLSQAIEITQDELTPNTYSPIRDQYPEGVRLTLADLIKYSVSKSDNIATDLLLQLVGGPSAVEREMKASGIKSISIRYNETQQQENWKYQYDNWISPNASNQLLKLFYENTNDQLSEATHRFLWNAMKATTTGEESFRGKIPEGVVIAHKTGHSGTNQEGITAAVNDVGILFLPHDQYFYLSVFVSNSKETDDVNQHIIAQTAKFTWDYYSALYDKSEGKK